jgi:secondary thiamine-phosphate synthase enzyme
METLNINSSKRTQFIDITDEVQKVVDRSGVENGMVFLYVPHTTAGLTINENADPSVILDMTGKLSRLVPEGDGYAHLEGNSDSHIKSSLFGNELFVFIENGFIKLGTWQGLYFAEFDGPRKRQVFIKITI